MTELVAFVALFALLAVGSVIVGMIVAGWIGRRREAPPRPSGGDQPPQPPASPEDRA